jgi:elongator complex protein 6
MILTLSADGPLVSSQKTALESNHAATLLGAAHEADVVMSLRLLDSGTARDVSGVVRITAGNQTTGMHRESRKVEEKELLYFVGGDGGVKVFERGQ